MDRFFGDVTQLGFVVPDLEKEMAHWINDLRVGPFFQADRVAPKDFTYRGQPGQPGIKSALANTGAMQIELIQLLDQEPSLWKDFVDAGRVGLQHIAYWTDDFDHVQEEAVNAGYTTGHRGVIAGGRFVYFEATAESGYAVELSEMSSAKRALFGAVREAASGWDGRDPIRSLDSLTRP